MAYTIRQADYFYTTVRDEPGEAYKLLATLASLGIDLVAFTAVPVGPMRTQLSIFPKDAGKLTAEARRDQIELEGPHSALLVQGDDELGALVQVHAKLRDAGVNVFASSGVSDGKRSFGYVIYVKPEDFQKALSSLVS